jgi:hypothetical protein
MGEILGITIITLLSAVSLGALLALLPYLLPQQVRQSQQIAAARPGRSLSIGLVNTLFFGLLAVVFSQGGEGGGLLGLLIILALASFALIGAAGILLTLCARLFPEQNERPGLLLRTAALLLTAVLTPFIGWFVLAPLLLLVGLGAAITRLVTRKKSAPPNEMGDFQD